MFNRTAVAYSGAATVAAVVETVAEAAVAGVAAAQEQFEAVEPADIVGRPDFLGSLLLKLVLIWKLMLLEGRLFLQP